jgi:hypothetical protein
VSYQLNKVHLLICIFAGLILAGGFVWHLFFGLSFRLFTMALWVSLAIVMFYFVGHVARSILINKVFVPVNEQYDFSEDEEYKAFMESLENKPVEPDGVMYDDPMQADPLASYDDSLDDPLMEPMNEMSLR